jgi:hypothetical protein
MQDIDHLVNVCKSIHGFCERSRDLSGLARKAIERAIFLSHRAQNESTALETEHRYIEYPSTTGMSSNTQVGDADSGNVDHHPTLSTISSHRDVNAQPTEGALTIAPFSTPIPTANRQRDGDQQNFLPQWRPCAPPSRPQQETTQSACLGSSSNVSNSIHAMLTEPNEAIYQPGSANHLTFHDQTYLGESQGYGGAGGSNSTWEECSDDQFGSLLGIWDVTFP